MYTLDGAITSIELADMVDSEATCASDMTILVVLTYYAIDLRNLNSVANKGRASSFIYAEQG